MPGLKKGTKLKRKCKQCGEMKYNREFPPDKRTKDGVSSYCLDCIAMRKGKGKNGGNGVEKSEPRNQRELAITNCPHCNQPIHLELKVAWVPLSSGRDIAPREQLHKRPNSGR